MLKDYVVKKVVNNLPFTPNEEQEEALKKIMSFLFSKQGNTAFIMKGYAGTGKTSILGALVKAMIELNQKLILMAPTGRAAKVLSLHSNKKAFTIHKKIYIQKNFTGDYSEFLIAPNLHKDTIFIVDEASMISNSNDGNKSFGSGCLLDDLIKYVYSGENCRLLLIGDDAQLPPIGQELSNALSHDVLEGYGLDILSAKLSEVARQKIDSGILFNATNIRNSINNDTVYMYPKIFAHRYHDIKIITGEELIDEISSAYGRDGIDSTMIITRSNKRANIYNQGIRNKILYREDEVSSGDLIMITKNNYHWSKDIKEMDFIANGEIMEVKRVRNSTNIYGLRFCDIELQSLDSDTEFQAKLLLDSLHSESASLNKESQDSFFSELIKDYEEVTNKRERLSKIKEDPYYNALQAKFAYAITCHKAQGGEWMNVFIDIGYITEEHLGISFYRWLYTAITRASCKLFFVNLPESFLPNPGDETK